MEIVVKYNQKVLVHVSQGVSKEPHTLTAVVQFYFEKSKHCIEVLRLATENSYNLPNIHS